LKLSASASPLKLITTFPTPDKATASEKTATEKDKPSIASRFFGWAHDKHSIKSPAQTPIAMSAVSPTEQWKVFPVFPRSHTATPKLPSVDEIGSEATPTQKRPSQGLPYETKLDLPKVEPRPQQGLPYETKLDTSRTQSRPAPAPKEPSMSISSPVGNSKEFGSTLADKLTRPTAPVTLGQQITRSGTPQQKQSPFNENIFRSGTPGPGRSPSGSPQIGSGGWDPGRALPIRNPPAGLQIHFPTMDGILNGESELPPPVIKPARLTRSMSQRAPLRASGRRGSGRESDDSLPDIEEREEGRSRSRRRRGSPDRRGRSYSRRPGDGSHMRSPSSPLPFSPQADLYKEKEDDFDSDEGYYTRPRGRREESMERGRGRSRSIQGGSIIRSPSSPLPMSAEAHLYRDEEEDSFDEQYYTRAKSQARAGSRARMGSRAQSRARDVSRPRADSCIRVREESRPRGESRIRAREESRPRIREESRPRIREESRPRVREESRPRIREESRPRLREESRARGESRARSRQPDDRGRSTMRIPNMMRSPSSPLPMSAEAAFYQYDDDEGDDDVPIRARSRHRDESRPRGRRREESMAGEREPMDEGEEWDLRRSRSERTLTSWVQQFDRSASVDRRPSVPELPSRAMSIRGLQGLPANPKIWKGSLSRAGSPAGTPMRGRSPAPGRSPLIGTPMNASSINEALSSMSPGTLPGRAMSPAPRSILGDRARSHSRGPSSLQNTPQIPQEFPFGENRGSLPQIPPMTNGRSQSVAGHGRRPSMGKHVPTPLKNITFYPTPKVQAPGSPPPLPIDMPVHPALQLNLPSVNGTTKISAGPNSHFRLGGGGSMRGKGSMDLGAHTIDSILGEPQGAKNHNNLIISIGMSNACLEEEAKTGRMSPPMNGDPRLGTPL